MPVNRAYLIRQVDLFTLKLFLSTVEEGQIGRAAARENIAPSTATKRIQDLEDIAGLPLLDRTPRGVSPTPAGAVLVRYLREIFGQFDNLRAELDAFSEGMRGEITIASARSIIAPFLADQIGGFARAYPRVEVVLREMENTAILAALRRGEADVGVYAAAQGLDESGLDIVPYRKDRLVAVVPRDHPLALRSRVDLAALLPANLIPVQALLAVITGAAARIGAEFAPRYSVRSAEVATSLVAAGLGVTIQPECLVGADHLDRVAVVELSEAWANRIIRIATARGRITSPAAGAFIDRLIRSPDPAPEGRVQGQRRRV